MARELLVTDDGFCGAIVGTEVVKTINLCFFHKYNVYPNYVPSCGVFSINWLL